MVWIGDVPPGSDLGIDLFLLRFLDRFWRQQGLCLAVGGFLGEAQFPQAKGVLRDKGVPRVDFGHRGFAFGGDAVALFLGDFLTGTIVI